MDIEYGDLSTDMTANGRRNLAHILIRYSGFGCFEKLNFRSVPININTAVIKISDVVRRKE